VTARARWPSVKSPPAPASLIAYLNETVSDAVKDLPGVGRRKLLVSTGFSVNERVFALVSRQGRVVVRLPDEALARELLALEGAEPWKYGSKAPPRGWVQLPEWMHDAPDALRTWLERAWQLGRAEPAPRRRKRARPAAGSGASRARTRRS
jgi:TfoX/Sxy family transcriptional regulator of competence genes